MTGSGPPDRLARVLQLTGQMQAALDRLSAEQPHPLPTGCVRLAGQLTAAAAGPRPLRAARTVS